MKRIITAFVLGCLILPSVAQAQNNNRIDICKENYTTLFGGEALTGKGTDPEFMDILQKFILVKSLQSVILTTNNANL